MLFAFFCATSMQGKIPLPFVYSFFVVLPNRQRSVSVHSILFCVRTKRKLCRPVTGMTGCAAKPHNENEWHSVLKGMGVSGIHLFLRLFFFGDSKKNGHKSVGNRPWMLVTQKEKYTTSYKKLKEYMPAC